MKITSTYQAFLISLCTLICFFSVGLSFQTTAAEKQTASLAVKGHFKQSKTIKVLKRPYNSAGTFVFIPKKGLLWQTNKPVASIKLFANNGVFSENAQGTMKKEAQVDNDFFLALFTTNETALMPYFTISESDASGDHCLTLTPKSKTLASLISLIDLCLPNNANANNIDAKNDSASTNVSAKNINTLEAQKLLVGIPEKITLTEVNGNITDIYLTLSAEKISQKELTYFD
jgi:hypothetical protein